VGLSPQVGRLAPAVKHTAQESGDELCEILQILIVSVVKNCKQCLQTALASGDYVPNPYRGFASGPHWGISVPQIPGL